MAISVLQSTGNSANTTAQSWTQAFGSNLTAGSILVVGFLQGSTTATASISDSGNSWTLQSETVASFAGISSKLYVWTAINTLNGVGDTVTINVTGGVNIHGNLFTIAEINGVNAVDQINSNNGQTSSGTTFTAAAITTTVANEIVISFGAGSSTVVNPLAPFSLLGHANGTSSFAVGESQIVSSVGTYTPTFGTNSGSTPMASVTFSLFQQVSNSTVLTAGQLDGLSPLITSLVRQV